MTNGTEEQQTDKLRAIGLIGLVDVVCTSEQIGFHKPDPRAFAALAHQLGAAPADCLFVGDNADHDVAGAQSAGMRAVLIDRYREGAVGLGAALDRVARWPLGAPLRGHPRSLRRIQVDASLASG